MLVACCVLLLNIYALHMVILGFYYKPKRIVIQTAQTLGQYLHYKLTTCPLLSTSVCQQKIPHPRERHPQIQPINTVIRDRTAQTSHRMNERTNERTVFPLAWPELSKCFSAPLPGQIRVVGPPRRPDLSMDASECQVRWFFSLERHQRGGQHVYKHEEKRR